jgi:hypothetical protein
MATISIDGKEYEIENLSPEAVSQIASLRLTDQKIADLQAELAIFQTARMAYARELLNLLPKTE